MVLSSFLFVLFFSQAEVSILAIKMMEEEKQRAKMGKVESDDKEEDGKIMR